MVRFVIRFTTGKKAGYEVFKSNDFDLFSQILDVLVASDVRIISIRMDDVYYKWVNNSK